MLCLPFFEKGNPMNIGKLAERNARALTRITETAPVVAKNLNIPGEILERIQAGNKDKAVEAMARIEAVADLLEHLAAQTPEADGAAPEAPAAKKRKGRA